MISLILVYKSDRSSSEFDLEDDFSLLERLYKNQPKNVVFLNNPLIAWSIFKTKRDVLIH